MHDELYSQVSPRILEEPGAVAPEVVRAIELAMREDDKPAAASYASHLGTGFNLNGDGAAALEWFRKAAKLEPESESHRLKLSESLIENGFHQQAVDVMVKEGDFPKELYSLLHLLVLLDLVVYRSPQVTQELKARLKETLKQTMLDELGFAVPEPEAGESPTEYQARVQRLVDKHCVR